MDLLFLLASRPGHVFSREVLTAALWPDTTVGEDALSRCVFKLRKALEGPVGGLIETIPKRGYRLIPPSPVAADARRAVPSSRPGPSRKRIAGAALGLIVIAVVGVVILLRPTPSPTPAVDRTVSRAADSYYQFTRADNEAAIVLYDRALKADPNAPEAQAGLAGALVQKHMRWPDGRDAPRPAGSALRAALASGRLAEPAAVADLRRAVHLARRAAAARPRDPEVQRAFGLALSASGRLAEAAVVYDRALADHPDDWGLLINRADLLDIEGRADAALSMLERAYEGMDRAYAAEPVRVRPWQAELGMEIGRRHEARAELATARAWYRRTLADDPSATAAAARLTALPPDPA